MKVSPSAVCIMAATACALGIPAAAVLGAPGLAFLFLFGVSVFGLVLFVLDIKA
jgi:hypothetical protein